MTTTRKLPRFKYAATLLGGMAVLAFAPAIAHAADNDPSGPGGCTYTDADGYDIPIHDGEDVFVDGKIVSCRGGTIIVTNPPKNGVGGVRPQIIGPNLPVFADSGSSTPTSPARPPVFNPNGPVFSATP
jgi:hypothetical protein